MYAQVRVVCAFIAILPKGVAARASAGVSLRSSSSLGTGTCAASSASSGSTPSLPIPPGGSTGPRADPHADEPAVIRAHAVADELADAQSKAREEEALFKLRALASGGDSRARAVLEQHEAERAAVTARAGA